MLSKYARIHHILNIKFLILIILISCSFDKNEQEISFKLERLKIELPTHCLTTYITQSTIKSNNNLLYLGYNYMHHSIDVFDLTNQKFSHSIKLQKEGPNGINNVTAFRQVSDSLFLIANTKEVALINSDGHKLSNHLFDNINKHDYYIDFRSRNDLIYDSKKDRIYTFIKKSGSNNNFEYLDSSVLGYIDLTKNELIPMNLYFLDEFKSEFFGDFSYVNIAETDDGAFINFPISSQFFKLQFSTEKVTILGKNKIVTNQISKDDFLDNEKRVDYFYSASYYDKIHYLERYNYITKVFVFGLDENESPIRKLEVNSMDGELIGQFDLEINYAINYFTDSENIYFNVMDVNESKLIFDVLKIQ